MKNAPSTTSTAAREEELLAVLTPDEPVKHRLPPRRRAAVQWRAPPGPPGRRPRARRRTGAPGRVEDVAAEFGPGVGLPFSLGCRHNLVDAAGDLLGRRCFGGGPVRASCGGCFVGGAERLDLPRPQHHQVIAQPLEVGDQMRREDHGHGLLSDRVHEGREELQDGPAGRGSPAAHRGAAAPDAWRGRGTAPPGRAGRPTAGPPGGPRGIPTSTSPAPGEREIEVLVELVGPFVGAARRP